MPGTVLRTTLCGFVHYCSLPDGVPHPAVSAAPKIGLEMLSLGPQPTPAQLDARGSNSPSGACHCTRPCAGPHRLDARVSDHTGLGTLLCICLLMTDLHSHPLLLFVPPISLLSPRMHFCTNCPGGGASTVLSGQSPQKTGICLPTCLVSFAK